MAEPHPDEGTYPDAMCSICGQNDHSTAWHRGGRLDDPGRTHYYGDGCDDPHGDVALTLWWCKQSNGVIVEHETTDWRRHQGHVRCIPVGYATERELQDSGGLPMRSALNDPIAGRPSSESEDSNE
jgi:hypothetical protein